MTTINWPSGRAFGIKRMTFGGSVAKSAWSGFFDGQTQSISHLANRLRCTVVLPAVEAQLGAAREAFFMSLVESGDWVRLWHFQREQPFGTMRGTPTIATTAAAGARTISINNMTPGWTLSGGDPIGAAGQLLFAGYAGATANGSGVMSLPLMWPTRVQVTSGNAVTWDKPYTTFQLPRNSFDASYGRRAWQAEVEVSFVEAF